MLKRRFGPKASKRADADAEGSDRVHEETAADNAAVFRAAERERRLERARAVLSEAVERPRSATVGRESSSVRSAEVREMDSRGAESHETAAPEATARPDANRRDSHLFDARPKASSPDTRKPEARLDTRGSERGSDTRAQEAQREVQRADMRARATPPRASGSDNRVPAGRSDLRKLDAWQAKPNALASNFPPSSNPFEDADPFESFEQCAPSEGGAHSEDPQGASAEPVYTRSSQRTRKPSAADLNNAKRPQRSLKGRALGYLSRREYSRAELSRKLRPYVEEADSLENLLDDLERAGWLSNERFVESVVHRRAGRMGGSRIIHELKRHAVGESLISETAGKLAQTEVARAQAVWEKKYGRVPETPAERAKQARFLAARGFSGSTIGKVLKGADEDFSDEPVDD